jgi:hypothetical protein
MTPTALTTTAGPRPWPGGPPDTGEPGRPPTRHRVRTAAVVAAVAVAVTVTVVMAGALTPNAGTGPGPGRATTSPGAPSTPPSFGAQRAAAAAGAPSTAPGPVAPDAVPAAADQTRVVKNGHVDLLVGGGQVEESLTRITSLAVARGGFVSDSSTSVGQGSPSGTVTVRIPSAAFETVVDQVRRLGRVQQLSTSGQDVTAQYVDLQARITAASQAQQRFLTILNQATTIGDVLAVQQQIDALNTQLDQLEGQQRLLDDQTSYGTLSVSVAQSAGALEATNGSTGWSRAWHDAVHGFAAGVEAVVRASGVLLFVALCAAAMAGAFWALWRRRHPRVV